MQQCSMFIARVIVVVERVIVQESEVFLVRAALFVFVRRVVLRALRFTVQETADLPLVSVVRVAPGLYTNTHT